MATIDGVNLKIVQNEDSTKDSNLFFMPLPYSDSSDAILIDLMGTSRTITISGKVVDTKENLISFIGLIEGIQNGQQEPSEYVGELITKQVMIESFNWNYEQGSPEELKYILTLKEGGI